MRSAGVVVQAEEISWLNHHPGRSSKRKLRDISLCRVHPSWSGGAIRACPLSIFSALTQEEGCLPQYDPARPRRGNFLPLVRYFLGNFTSFSVSYTN